jgi:hypothetical protein
MTSFSDDDLKRLKVFINSPHGSVGFRSSSGEEWSNTLGQLSYPAKDIEALVSRLEAAELALEDADCDCAGSPDVCRFYKRREAWRKAAGKGEGK